VVEIIFLISEGRYNLVVIPGEEEYIKLRTNHKVEYGLCEVYYPSPRSQHLG
jgi:hypothetical protein